MKKFLLRMNRGIALGITLLVVLVVYLTADALAFGRETEEIREFIAGYLEELERLNAVFFGSVFGSVEESSQIGREQMREEASAFLNRYFVEYRRSSIIGGGGSRPHSLSSKQSAERALNFVVNFYADYADHREMLRASDNISDNIDYDFLENHFSRFTAERADFRLVNISYIRKQAPNAVRVNFVVRPEVSVSPDGDGFAFLFDGFDSFSFRAHGDMTVSALLFRRGGEWRIADVQRFFFGGHGGRVTTAHDTITIVH